MWREHSKYDNIANSAAVNDHMDLTVACNSRVIYM